MNCQQFENQIDDYLDDRLDDVEAARMHRHLDGCEECMASVETARWVRQGLGELADSSPPEGFAERVIERAVKQAPTPAPARGHNRLGWGLAASLLLCAVVIGWLQFERSDGSREEAVLLDSQVKIIRLAFDSTEPVARARVTISLSENLGIEGYGANRSLSWETALKPGVNLLALPVYATSLGDGEIVANLRIGDRQKQIVVRTMNPDATFFDAPDPGAQATRGAA